jgi:hypothetical protein
MLNKYDAASVEPAQTDVQGHRAIPWKTLETLLEQGPKPIGKRLLETIVTPFSAGSIRELFRRNRHPIRCPFHWTLHGAGQQSGKVVHGRRRESSHP